MDKERRKAPRSTSHIPIDLYDRHGHAVTGEGELVNLSVEGAMLMTGKPLRKSQQVRFRFQPGKAPVLDLDAKVIWSQKRRKPFQYGVQFSEFLKSDVTRS